MAVPFEDMLLEFRHNLPAILEGRDPMEKSMIGTIYEAGWRARIEDGTASDLSPQNVPERIKRAVQMRWDGFTWKAVAHELAYEDENSACGSVLAYCRDHGIEMPKRWKRGVRHG